MMVLVVIVLAIFNVLTTDSTHVFQALGNHKRKSDDAHNVFSSYNFSFDKTPSINDTFNDIDSNVLRLPVHWEYQIPKKAYKRVPKRTVQKIIKLNKPRKRHMYSYFNQVTTAPTEVTDSVEYKERDLDKETLPESTTTQQQVQRKKMKKWKASQIRLPKPFQKFKKDQAIHHRMKRDSDRQLFILQDLDEVEFVSGEDGNDKIVTHIKNYW